MDTRFLYALMYEQAICLLFWACTKIFLSDRVGYQGGKPLTSWIVSPQSVACYIWDRLYLTVEKTHMPMYNKNNE